MDEYTRATFKERRLELTEEDLQALCQGVEVHRDGVGLILQDIGLGRMLEAVHRGRSEAGRRLRESARKEDACPACRGTHRVAASERPEVVGTMPCPDCTKRFDQAQRS